MKPILQYFALALVCHKHKFEVTVGDRKAPENDAHFQAYGNEFNNNELRDPVKQKLMRNATLALEAQHKLTLKAIDDVVKSPATLISDNVTMFKEKVRDKLVAHDLPNDFLETIPTDYFLEQLDNSCKRSLFYENNMSQVNQKW